MATKQQLGARKEWHIKEGEGGDMVKATEKVTGADHA